MRPAACCGWDRVRAGKDDCLKALLTTSRIASKPYIITGLICLITLLCYLPSLRNGFVSTWDDGAYVISNSLLRDVSPGGIIRIFTDDHRQSYALYHPLTTLTLALNYRIDQSPLPFHITNLILHLLNTVLVFVFVYLISDKSVFVAGFVSLWFGIHPVHVESVAWISERKDVLYSLFYLLALITYWQYIGKKLCMKWYIITVVLFLLSLLSKPIAVNLPLVLLCLDYLAGRKFSARIITEKVPFVVISIFIGLVAMKSQSVAITSSFPFVNKVLHATYGFPVYIAKSVFPINLSAFYPYPYPLVNYTWVGSSIPSILYVTLIASIIIVAGIVRLYFVKSDITKHLLFGIGFYVVTILLVLQFIPVGMAIITDHYLYIPYIGLFYAMAVLINKLLIDKNVLGKVFLASAAALTIWFCVLTVQQIKVWQNDDTLWTNTINIYPHDSRVRYCYVNRALYYYNVGKYDAAINDLSEIMGFNPNDDSTLVSMASIYGQNKQDIDKSILYFKKAIDINENNIDALRGLAKAYMSQGNYGEALKYTEKAIGVLPTDANVYLIAAEIHHRMGNSLQENLCKRKASELGGMIKVN